MIIIIIIAMMMPNIWIKVYLWVREASGDRWPRSLLCHGQNLFPFIIISIIWLVVLGVSRWPQVTIYISDNLAR